MGGKGVPQSGKNVQLRKGKTCAEPCPRKRKDNERIGLDTRSVRNGTCTSTLITAIMTKRPRAQASAHSSQGTRVSLSSCESRLKYETHGASRTHRPLPSSHLDACSLLAAAVAKSTVVFSRRDSSTLNTFPSQQKGKTRRTTKLDRRRYLCRIVSWRGDLPTYPLERCLLVHLTVGLSYAEN